MSIKSWHEDDRPREKMLSNGAEVLSRSELLAILINNGSKEKSALDLAKEIMTLADNSLHTLARLELADLMRVKGIGQAKAVAIKAAMELAVRKQTEPFKSKPVLNSPQVIAPFLRSLIGDKSREHFIAIFLNQACRYISHAEMSKGGLTGTVADIKVILKKAIEAEASLMVVAHNHPSGNLKPSKQDKALTEKLKEAAKIVDIQVLDHLIVSQEGYYSFSDDGIL